MSNRRKVPAAAAAMPEKAAPELLGKGRYAIYQDPVTGDGIVSYRPDDQDQDSHQVVPARAWSVILAAIRGELGDIGPLALMAQMIKAGR